jgi:hypothetical protein
MLSRIEGSHRQDRQPQQTHNIDTTAQESASVGLPARPTLCELTSRPCFDLRPKPQLGPSIAELADWTRHVVVPVLIHAHGVAVSETEELGDAVCVEEIVDVYLAAHIARLLQYSDPSEPPFRFQ